MNGQSASRRLVRLPAHGKLGGVCAGLAEYFDADVTLVRLAWVILSIVPGGFVGGLIAYLAAWIVMPDSPGPITTSTSGRQLTRSVVDRKICGVCGGLAAYLDVDATAIRVPWAVL